MNKVISLACIILCVTGKLFTQTISCEDLNPNSGKLLEAGIAAYDKGNYQEAAKYYLKIFPGDTNYYYAQYELGITYDALKQHEDVIKIAERLLALNEGNRIQNTNMLGNALDGMGKSEEALKVYDEALALYPNEYLLHYNKGITLFLTKKYPEAEKEFIRSAELNPLHQGSHYFLGLINMMAGRYIQGMMALEYSLLLDVRSNKYTSAIQTLDESSVLQFPKAEEAIILSSEIDEAGDYSAVNEIYKSLLALNDKYKPKKLPNLRVIKQSALFFDNLESINATDQSFYTRYYFQFFKKIKERKLVNTFLAQAFANTTNEALQKLFVSEKKNLDKLALAFREFTAETTSKVYISHNGKNYFCMVEYNAKGSINIAFELTKDGKDVEKDGIVLVFYDDGGIYKETRLIDGKLNGECKKFAANGVLTETCRLIEGTEQGAAKEYYPTGELFATMNYKDGLIDGEVKVYYPDGKLKRVYTLEKGVNVGNEKRYYNDGKLSSDYNYTNGEFNGSMKDYFHNGKISYEYSYKDGKFDGSFKGYFSNGNISTEQNYKVGVLVGAYKDYYSNGKIKEEGSLDDKGNRTGVWKTYYYNGVLSNETSYMNGQKEGLGYEFDRDGVKHYEFQYKGGNYTMIKFFDKSGNVIKEFNEDKNVLKYTFYTPEGLKSFEGSVKNGKADGAWTTWYTTTGELFKTTNYKDGKMDGELIEYFCNGLLKQKSSYKDDVQSGLSTFYFEDGKTIQSQYCSTIGNPSGHVNHYFPNGSKQEELYFLFGEINGPVKKYDLLGRLYAESNYVNGAYLGEINYDSLGNEIFNIKTTSGLVPYIKYYPNGQVYRKGTYLNGELHDSLIYYYPDGKLQAIMYYENGKIEGKSIWYDHLGNISEERNFINGKFNGPRIYYSNGRISEQFEYMDDEEYGKAKYFYPSGNIEYEIERENGMSHGWGIWYDENGNEIHKSFYRAGDPIYYTYKDKNGKWLDPIILQDHDGDMKSFYVTGKKLLDRKYKGGNLDGPSLMYFPDGSPYSIYNFINGSHNGAEKEYYSNHKLRKEENYWMGLFHGPQKYYNEDGSLFMELSFEYGNLNGACKYYGKKGNLLYTVVYYQDTPVEIR